jgi:hypothetical protein
LAFNNDTKCTCDKRELIDQLDFIKIKTCLPKKPLIRKQSTDWEEIFVYNKELVSRI